MKAQRSEHPQSPWEVFRVPILLAVLSAVGLVAALVGDGTWDLLSWVTLLIPVAAIVRSLRRSG
jgi:hypothetical protein